MIAPKPNFPTSLMDQTMGAGTTSDIQPQSDAEETAIAYVEAAVAMLKSAAESFPPLAPAVSQMAQVMNQLLRQTLQGAQAQAGPEMPPPGALEQGGQAPEGQPMTPPPGLM